MEMVIAKPEYVNAQIIMSMHKIAHTMAVSTYCKQFCFILLSNKMCNNEFQVSLKVRFYEFGYSFSF